MCPQKEHGDTFLKPAQAQRRLNNYNYDNDLYVYLLHTNNYIYNYICNTTMFIKLQYRINVINIILHIACNLLSQVIEQKITSVLAKVSYSRNG